MAAPKNSSAILVLALLGIGVAIAVGSSMDDTGPDGGGSGGYDVDYRDEAADVRYGDQSKWGNARGELKRTYRSPRSMSKVDGIVVHHVGVSNVGAGAIKKVTYHMLVHHDGKVYWLHPFDTYLLHGGILNSKTIGISVSGSFGDPATELPPAQAAGLRRAIAFAKSQGNAEGADIRKIWTHRQASPNRGLDPGRSPYREGVMWAVNALGLEHDPNETLGNGLQIPESWLASTVSLDPQGPGGMGMFVDGDDELDHADLEPDDMITSFA